MPRALQIPEIWQGQALPLQSFLLVGMVRPLRSHPNPTPKRIVGAALAVARLRGLPAMTGVAVARFRDASLREATGIFANFFSTERYIPTGCFQKS